MTKIKLKLKTEKLLDKKNKELKDPAGQLMYRQHDNSSIIELLSIWDSSKSKGMEDYRRFLIVKDIFEKAWRNDEKEVELSLDQSSFIKDYFSNIKDKSRQVGLKESHLRTIISIVDQLK